MAEAAPSEFFPQPELLMGSAGVINSYIRSLYWAFTGLVGLGNFESTPVSTAECILVLLLHVIGVTLYAVLTGNVVSILEDVSSRDNEIAKELSELGSFMNDCAVPSDVQGRVMQGYLMKTMIPSRPSRSVI